MQQAIACVDPAHRHHQAYLHERLGRYLWMAGEGERAREAYRRAVELVPTDPVSSWQAAVVSGHAQLLMLTGRFDEARTEAERAIALAAQVPDGRPTEGHARNDLGVALAHLGEVDRGIAELHAAAAIAREQFDDVDDVARAVVNLNSVLFDAGRFPEALAVALDGIATIDQLGLQRRKGVWCRCDAADTLLVLGRTDEAEVLLREAALLNPEGIDAVRVHGMRGALALRRGRLEEARRQLELARRLGRSVVDGHLILPIHQALRRDTPLARRLAGRRAARLRGLPPGLVGRGRRLPGARARRSGRRSRRRRGGRARGAADRRGASPVRARRAVRRARGRRDVPPRLPPPRPARRSPSPGPSVPARRAQVRRQPGRTPPERGRSSATSTGPAWRSSARRSAGSPTAGAPRPPRRCGPRGRPRSRRGHSTCCGPSRGPPPVPVSRWRASLRSRRTGSS